MNKVVAIKSLLQQAVNIPEKKRTAFYKTGPGQYAQHDRFMGVNVPTLRKIAKTFYDLPLPEIQALLSSVINEERLLTLFILVGQYQKAETHKKETLYQFYLSNIKQVNNWNLVDASAHLIVGAHLLQADRAPLVTLAKSKILWERRIAIVATWYFIRNNDLEWTFKLARMLLQDTHDLIHKAVGWMLREIGKKNQEV